MSNPDERFVTMDMKKQLIKKLIKILRDAFVDNLNKAIPSMVLRLRPEVVQLRIYLWRHSGTGRVIIIDYPVVKSIFDIKSVENNLSYTFYNVISGVNESQRSLKYEMTSTLQKSEQDFKPKDR